MSLKNAQSCLALIEESEEKFRKIAENSFVGMFIYNEYFIYVNDAFVQMTGYTKSELLAMHPWDLAPETYKDMLKALIQKRLNGEMFTSIQNDIPLVKKDGRPLAVKISTETIHYQGEYAGIGILMDISDIIKKNQMIKVLVQALAQSDDIVFISDVQGTIEYANDALLNIYGYTEDEVVGQKPQLFSSKRHDNSFYKKLWNTILSGNNYHQTIINKTKSGSIVHIDTKITPIKDDLNEKISYFVVTARDITKQVLQEKKLKKLATIDTLTQVANRYQLSYHLDAFIKKANESDYSFSVLMFDIDYFKKINDTYGHYVGDCVLKAFSKIVMQNIRAVDKFGRWGGEEFLLLLEDTNEHEAMQIGQKLNRIVAETKFEALYSITVSIGVTEYRRGDTKERCIERVDNALYAAKNLGRNRVVFN
jgi:diguanylate cyclase (GGDEF)-like protein/PAS domain S-box-containing protein